MPCDGSLSTVCWLTDVLLLKVPGGAAKDTDNEPLPEQQEGHQNVVRLRCPFPPSLLIRTAPPQSMQFTLLYTSWASRLLLPALIQLKEKLLTSATILEASCGVRDPM